MFRLKCGQPVLNSFENVTASLKKLEIVLRYLNRSALDESVRPVQMARSILDPPTPPAANPVVVMHGLMGSRVNWNSVGRSLCASTHRKIITVDARNHGNSPHSPNHSYQHMACDIKLLTEELGVKRTSLIGHSMGGRAVMYFALCWPELVDKLVVVDISPVRISSSLSQTRQYLAAMSSMTLAPGLSMSQARKQADEQLSMVVPDVGLRQFLLMNLVHGDDGKSFKWKANLESILHNFEYVTNFPPISTTYDGPTQFIAGELSDYVRPEDEPAIQSIFTSAKFEYVSGAAHLVHVQKPQEFVRIVTQFLAVS